MLAEVEVPFVHRWSRDTSHPLLATAAIDVDGDGRDEVFLGGSDGQLDALIAWRNGQLADIAAQMGIGDTTAAYGALSLDFNADSRVDLLTVGHAGLTLWLNRDGRFELYLSMFVQPKLFRSPVFNDPAHAKRNILLRNMGELDFLDVTDAVTGGLQNTFTASFVDLDGDGRNDVLWAHMDGQRAYLSRTEGRFRAVRLPDAPASIGARVRLAINAP